MAKKIWAGALLTISTTAALDFALSGQAHIDGNFFLSQQAQDRTQLTGPYAQPNLLRLTRARLDFSGSMMPLWDYHVQLEIDEKENDQVGLDPYLTSEQSSIPQTSLTPELHAYQLTVAQAFVQSSVVDDILLSFGKIPAPEISSDRLYYRPYISMTPINRAIGTVGESSGNHFGWSAQGCAGPIGYHIGLWEQTDLRKLDLLDNSTGISAAEYGDLGLLTQTVLSEYQAFNFDSRRLRLGIGGRINYTHAPSHASHVGLGIGYSQAPLNMSILLNVVGQYADNSSAAQYSSTSFKDLTSIAADINTAFHNMQLNLGYQYQKSGPDIYDATNSESATLSIFDQDGTAIAYWVEAGYLFHNASYHFDKNRAVITGVALHERKPTVEVTARYGYERRSNIIALVSAIGWEDYNTDQNGRDAQLVRSGLLGQVSVIHGLTDRLVVISVDNTGSTAPQTVPRQNLGNTQDVFVEKMTAWSVGINYYVSEYMVLKAECSNQKHQFHKQEGLSSWTDSLHRAQIAQLRVRADYRF